LLQSQLVRSRSQGWDWIKTAIGRGAVTSKLCGLWIPAAVPAHVTLCRKLKHWFYRLLGNRCESWIGVWHGGLK
jgi:hypothetical protein